MSAQHDTLEAMNSLIFNAVCNAVILSMLIRQKVPSRNCPEFLNFRWAMTVANIEVGFGTEIYANGEKLRKLNAVERQQLDALRVRHRRFDRKHWQQGDAHAGGDHLPQGLQAGRAKAFLFASAGQRANFQRLVAQAVAVV